MRYLKRYIFPNYKLAVSFQKFCKDISSQDKQRFIFPRWWSVLKSSEKKYSLMVVVTFKKFNKVLQRYILPRFAKIYLPKVAVSSQHTCLTLATLYLPSIGPAPANLLRSGPGLVTVNADNSWTSTSDESWSLLPNDDKCKWRKSLPAHPAPVRDWSSGSCQSAGQRQQQFHTGAK